MLQETVRLDWRSHAPSEPHDVRSGQRAEIEARRLCHEDHRETAKLFPNHTPQYSDLYRVRLKALELVLTTQHPDLVKLSKMEAGQRCSVIGCLFKIMKSRKSYVKAIEEGETLQEKVDFDHVEPREDDEFYIENGTGKRMLNLEGAILHLQDGRTVPATIHTILSGIVARLDCQLVSDNEVKVFGIHLPGAVPSETISAAPTPPTDGLSSVTKLMKKVAKGDKPKLAAFVSGLELDPTNAEMLGDVALFRDFMLGRVGSTALDDLLSCVSTVVFTGNYISFDQKLNKQLMRTYEYKEKQQDLLDQINASLKAADEVMAELATRFQVVALPGELDISDSFLPQRALPSFCFPKSSLTGRLARVSNPGLFTLHNRVFLCSDGCQVSDMLHLSQGLTSELDVLEQLLAARHFAPNSPETFPCFPAKGKDPLIIEQACHFFVAGEAKHAGSRVVRGGTNPVQLIAVPAFKKTKSIILVDTESLETWEATFGAA